MAILLIRISLRCTISLALISCIANHFKRFDQLEFLLNILPFISFNRVPSTSLYCVQQDLFLKSVFCEMVFVV